MGGKTTKAPRRTREGVLEKQCTGCHKFMPEHYDYFSPQGDKAFAAVCRPCSLERQRARKDAVETPPREVFVFPPMLTTDEELTGAALARYEQGVQIVQTFSIYRALDLLTYGWGRATQAQDR